MDTTTAIIPRSVCMIGCGNMGGAIAHAIVKNCVEPQNLLIVDIDEQKRRHWETTLHCQVQARLDSNLSRYQVIMLQVKPQMSVPVMQELSQYLQPNQVVASVMAGIQNKTMQHCMQHQRVVRIMPNTPAQIGEGMSAFYCADCVTTEEKDFIRQMLEACGSCIEVDSDERVDRATGICGSGPAYVFYFAEHMCKAALKLGFNPEDARQLVLGTLRGAVHLWENQDIEPEILKQRVTSKGGTTAAALGHFEQSLVGPSIQGGVDAAVHRAGELAAEFHERAINC
eukprot:gnl/Trimastix_PCT/700.p1 GENE.gnl/Trimastix_PCT/700~~gnl/Trimastix_PCT/700.p1  ORF type:complete len:284 (+),score=86.72 gnl/Trimastix_PCT/700:74-925(+)